MTAVSFVVIAFNEEKNLNATIWSIRAQAELRDFEIIVVNDGSTDATLSIANELAAADKRIKVVDLLSNQGRGAARKAGCDRAKGQAIAFVDGDILLSRNWWQRTSENLEIVDACGGTAVPDGDVSYVYRIFQLEPLIRPHTIAVTGSNGLFRRSVFDVVKFDSSKRNGEDVDLLRRMHEAGLTSITVPDLIVEHNESKSFGASFAWLFESGIGATNQFKTTKVWRFPDLVSACFALMLLGATALSIFGLTWLAILAPFAFVLAAGSAHMVTKFRFLTKPGSFLAASLVQSSLLLSYLCGRLIGAVLPAKVGTRG
jgi:glycosyltransferase involved in cell wall biosynthesis